MDNNAKLKEFISVCKKELSQNEEYLDTARSSILSKMYIKLSVIFLAEVFVFCFFAQYITVDTTCCILIILAFLALFALLFFQIKNSSEKKFKLIIKPKIQTNLLKFWGDLQRYKSSIYLSELGDSGLFNELNEGSYTLNEDDSFKGTYKGVNFRISELALTSKDCSYPEEDNDLFKGIVIIYDNNKQNRAHTTIFDKYFLNLKAVHEERKCRKYGKMAGLMLLIHYSGNIYKHFTERKNYSNIILEDPKFMKRFKVEADSEIESRYLLTPAFMDRFYNLKTNLQAQHISCSFYDNKFLVAIGTKKDLFEIGSLFSPSDDEKVIREFYSEVNSIFEMIDYFKLDEKTGL